MFVKIMKFLILIIIGCSQTNVSVAKIIYAVSAEESDGAFIETPHNCAQQIGSGGNLFESGIRYLGKCQGAGLTPEISGTHNHQKYLKFHTEPSYTGTDKTRTELAVTDRMFPFRENFYIGFRLMIPDDVSITEDFFYLMQLWQCSGAGPIAGVRMSRGESHKINFMTSGDSTPAGRGIGGMELIPNMWHRFIIKVNVNPRNGDGEFVVWKDEEAGKLYDVNRSYGYYNIGTCAQGERPPQHFRIKFGIYKGNEPNKYFETRFDDIRIGDTYQSVKPW